MKGIIFNLLQEVIEQEHDPDMWDFILEETGAEGIYSSIGSYPDENFFSLIRVISKKFKQPTENVIRWFGKTSFPLLAKRFSQLVEKYQDTPSFLLQLNDVIHPEVKKLYEGAEVPVFDFNTPDKQRIEILYSSKRKLCKLAEGFIDGAARNYKQSVQISQTQCMLKGDVHCKIICQFD
jgi:predicted hydrocarbon binding protein